MKTIFLVLLFTVMTLAQSGLLILMEGDAFNPLTYDANTIALYDGDLELTTSAWGDQSGHNYDLTLGNTPTVVAGAINGHQALRLDGNNQYGQKTTTPTLNQPITVYMVVKTITWNENRRFYDGATSTGAMTYVQLTLSPNTAITSGTNLNSDPDLAVGDYGIMTAVFNGANSEIRTNLNAAVTGNAGTTNNSGITLGARNTLAAGYYGNIEVAYLLYRQGADDTATQDLFIAFLKDRFGI